MYGTFGIVRKINPHPGLLLFKEKGKAGRHGGGGKKNIESS
jgi:hypothetical protein